MQLVRARRAVELQPFGGIAYRLPHSGRSRKGVAQDGGPVGTTAEPSHPVNLLSPFLRYRLPQHECGYTCRIYLCEVCRNEGCQSWLEGSESQAYGLGIPVLDFSSAKNLSLRGDSRENLHKFGKEEKRF